MNKREMQYQRTLEAIRKSVEFTAPTVWGGNAITHIIVDGRIARQNASK